MLIKISEGANRGRPASPVSRSLQFDCSDSRLKAAGWADTDNPHSRCSLRADLHEGSNLADINTAYFFLMPFIRPMTSFLLK